jgi:hypothetical protein
MFHSTNHTSSKPDSEIKKCSIRIQIVTDIASYNNMENNKVEVEFKPQIWIHLEGSCCFTFKEVELKFDLYKHASYPYNRDFNILSFLSDYEKDGIIYKNENVCIKIKPENCLNVINELKKQLALTYEKILLNELKIQKSEIHNTEYKIINNVSKRKYFESFVYDFFIENKKYSTHHDNIPDLKDADTIEMFNDPYDGIVFLRKINL